MGVLKEERDDVEMVAVLSFLHICTCHFFPVLSSISSLKIVHMIREKE
jgi:hypothetical protein